jgi:hypothetical protein
MGEWSDSRSGFFSLWNKSDSHRTKFWLGPRFRLGDIVKRTVSAPTGGGGYLDHQLGICRFRSLVKELGYHRTSDISKCSHNMIEVYSVVPNACICPSNRVWRERQDFRHDDAEGALSVHFQFYASWSVYVTVKTLQEPAGVRSGDLFAHSLAEGVSTVKKILQYNVFIFM